MTRTLVFLSLVLFSLPLTAARRRPSATPARFPDCAMITGTPAVTFTRDAGATLAPRAETLQGIAYTYGLAALDVPNTLLAWHKSSLLISTDAGCSWRIAGTPDDIPYPPRVTAGVGERAYVWSDNQLWYGRWDARGLRMLKAPGAIVGFEADPAVPDRVRAADADGRIWRSDDGGETWELSGRLETVTNPVIFYRFAFDPNDLDHIVAGTTIDGAYVSRDGGRSWQRATGLGNGASNTFNLVVSPADGNRVWAMSLNLPESDSGAPSHGRHIYVSSDGGASFTPVVDEQPGVKLINGPIMAADPRNRDVLYFVFGTHTQGYGTDLFRYDHASRRLTSTHNEHHGIDAIEFSPVDPLLMYLGLEVVQGH